MPPRHYPLTKPSYGRLLAEQWAVGRWGWRVVALAVRWGKGLLQDGHEATTGNKGLGLYHPPSS